MKKQFRIAFALGSLTTIAIMVHFLLIISASQGARGSGRARLNHYYLTSETEEENQQRKTKPQIAIGTQGGEAQPSEKEPPPPPGSRRTRD